MGLRCRALSFAAIVLIAAGAAAQERLGVLVVSTGPQLEAQAGKLQGALEDDLGREHTVARWGDLVGMDTASIRAVRKLRQLVQTSFRSCAAMVEVCEGSKADEAVASLPTAAAGMLPQDVQRTYAAVAATRWGMNLPQDAETAATMALSIDPGLPAPKVTTPPGFDELWERARFESQDRARTSLDVSSEPPGARILIDGTPKGFTPATVPGISQGAHLVQLERVGYQMAGTVVSLTGSESNVSMRLAPAPAFRPLDVVAAAQAAERGGGTPLATIAGHYGLSWLIAGVLTPKSGGASTLTIVAVRSADQRVLGKKKLDFDGDEYGTAGKVASRAASQTLEGNAGANHGGEAGKKKSGDPLDNLDGTEDW